MNDNLLQLKDVMAMTTLGRSTLYYMISEGTFPKPKKLGDRKARWQKIDIEKWLESKGVTTDKPIKNNQEENSYPQDIINSVDILCNELEKYYPKAFQQKYDSLGLPRKKGYSFHSRMLMGVWIELIKAGAFYEK